MEQSDGERNFMPRSINGNKKPRVETTLGWN
jgi:hypothetical protein